MNVGMSLEKNPVLRAWGSESRRPLLWDGIWGSSKPGSGMEVVV